MATRNGTDIVESTVEVIDGDRRGFYTVVSKVVTLEYTECSWELAEFLANELRETGTTYPKPSN